jgi:hypothetical protein
VREVADSETGWIGGSELGREGGDHEFCRGHNGKNRREPGRGRWCEGRPIRDNDLEMFGWENTKLCMHNS